MAQEQLKQNVDVSINARLLGKSANDLPATAGCGFAIGPQADLGLENSGSQSLIAFLRACRGWYMFGDSVVGTSSPDKPSSVSVSSLMSADTESSEKMWVWQSVGFVSYR